MAFVHSLVKVDVHGKTGWCAPAELGEAAPHYISFVIPVDGSGNFLPRYTCEMITTAGKRKSVASRELVKEGEDTFVLRLGSREFWFAATPGPKEGHRLPYVGKLRHQDFEFPLTEIEPEEPNKLDRLYDEEDTFVIGCEAFTHYSGIERFMRSR